MSETGGTLVTELSTEGGAPSRALRSAGGKANDASTIPPMDAISWRRLTSIVKSDLLSRNRKLHLRGPTLLMAQLRGSKFSGTKEEIPPNRSQRHHCQTHISPAVSDTVPRVPSPGGSGQASRPGPAVPVPAVPVPVR